MQKITSVIEIKDAIRLLEERQAEEGQVLKEHFFVVVNSAKPINLIKNTLHDVTASPDLLSNMLSTTIGLAAGYLTNRTLVRSTGGVFKKLLGTILQFSITTAFVRNPEAVKSWGHSLIQRFFSKKASH